MSGVDQSFPGRRGDCIDTSAFLHISPPCTEDKSCFLSSSFCMSESSFVFKLRLLFLQL